jgi:5-methylthioribose kinase
VHGDFSPKNLLIYGNSLMLIDFEVGHYGDPAFDLGFFLSHLTLKAY